MGSEAARAVPTSSMRERLWEALVRFAAQPEVLLAKLALIVLVVLAALLLYWIVRGMLRRAQARLELAAVAGSPAAKRRAQRAATMLSLMANLAKWVLLLGAIVEALVIAGLNLVPVLTGAGILGVAVAFGAQTLVRDFMSGFFLLLEGQYAVDDYVALNGVFGRVEEVGLRVTVLRDADNRRVYLPNGAISSVVVYEQDQLDWVLECPLLAAGDAPAAADAMTEVIKAARRLYPGYFLAAGEVTTADTPDGGALVRAPISVFPAQEWLVKEEIPASLRRTMQARELAMPEGAAPRAYQDLRHFPQVGTRHEVS
ncbi:MAG: mechanosensitive ion channel [Armatimonadetes bacterium]|nr:mechanosensitive ion channel [Armatimonadota bacterium]